MANIIPFKGLKYDNNKVKFQDVVSYPYDKINKDLLKLFSEKSTYNIARLIKGDFIRDEKNDDWYDEVKQTLDKWIIDKILKNSEKPCLYIYEQVYTCGEKTLRRISFSALGELESFRKGNIKPHENTFSGPKQERYKLLNATHTNFGHIFMLFYGHKNNIIEKIKEKVSLINPECDFLDDFGIEHRFWEISDKSFIEEITSQMKEQNLLIADGHHRYETALEFYESMKDKDPENADKFKFRMMTFVDINDPSLVILPTHRVFYPEEETSKEVLMDRLNKHFEVSEPIAETDENKLKEILSKEAGNIPLFLMLADNDIYKIRMKESSYNSIEQVNKKLSVSVLQDFIAQDIFEKDVRSMAPGKDMDYHKNIKSVLKSVEEHPNSVGFILNPTLIEQVKAVVEVGGRMPQKSTDFYPKIYTGFVINKMD